MYMLQNMVICLQITLPHTHTPLEVTLSSVLNLSVRRTLVALQIFFNSDHLGGNDDLQKLHEEGKLEGLVAKVTGEAPGMMKDTWYHPWY